MNNPFMDLSPAEIDVLDDMRTEWQYSEDRELCDGPKRSAAFDRLKDWIDEAYMVKVNYRDVEKMDD